MTLIERLVEVARLWAAANDRSLARLATIVVNDGKLFDRLANGGTCTVTTLEKLAAHLCDPEHWPEAVPAEALALHTAVTSVSPAGPAICVQCDLRAEDPAVRSCTSLNCPLSVKDAA